MANTRNRPRNTKGHEVDLASLEFCHVPLAGGWCLEMPVDWLRDARTVERLTALRPDLLLFESWKAVFQPQLTTALEQWCLHGRSRPLARLVRQIPSLLEHEVVRTLVEGSLSGDLRLWDAIGDARRRRARNASTVSRYDTVRFLDDVDGLALENREKVNWVMPDGTIHQRDPVTKREARFAEVAECATALGERTTLDAVKKAVQRLDALTLEVVFRWRLCRDHFGSTTVSPVSRFDKGYWTMHPPPPASQIRTARVISALTTLGVPIRISTGAPHAERGSEEETLLEALKQAGLPFLHPDFLPRFLAHVHRYMVETSRGGKASAGG